MQLLKKLGALAPKAPGVAKAGRTNREVKIVMPGDIYPTVFEQGAKLSGHALQCAKDMNAIAGHRPAKAPASNKAAAPTENKR